MTWRIYKLLGIAFLAFNHCKNQFQASYCGIFPELIYLEPTITMFWAAYIKLVVYHHNMKEFFDSLKCVNENNCICHTLRYVSVPLILGKIKGISQCKNVRFWNVNEIYIYILRCAML